MQILEAEQFADDVLIQERTTPGLYYSTQSPILGPIGTPHQGPAIKQSRFYYTVSPRPEGLQFSSPNYDLLCIIYGHLPPLDQGRFMGFLMRRLTREDVFARLDLPVLDAGKWDTCTSETPLIAEFVVRQGGTDALLRQLRIVPFTPALVQLLLQIRTIISRDFRRFTSSQLGAMSKEAELIAQRVRFETETQREVLRKQPFRKQPTEDTVSKNTRHYVLSELPEIADVIIESCREARFYYLRDSLTEGANLEVNQDKIRVSSYLERLGFSEDLSASLNKAETLYLEAASGFDYKSSMGHLRAFLENLHLEASRRVHQRAGGDLPESWGTTQDFLQQHEILTKQEKLFVIRLYTLVSDEGVHTLQTGREYARLLRNISIEYGLLLLTKLDSWTTQHSSASPVDPT
jgi:hypothetical protein